MLEDFQGAPSEYIGFALLVWGVPSESGEHLEIREFDPELHLQLDEDFVLLANMPESISIKNCLDRPATITGTIGYLEQSGKVGLSKVESIFTMTGPDPVDDKEACFIAPPQTPGP